jgi:hypothetical protein
MKRLRFVLPPLVAVATLMAGLRIGAGTSVRTAVVYGAPPGLPTTRGTTRLAWQLLTLVDDRGVKETVPMRGITAVARSHDSESRWVGESNLDGIAEMEFEFPNLRFGDGVHVDVRADDGATVLAQGDVEWGKPTVHHEMTLPNVRPTVREGPAKLDVMIEGSRLITGFPTSMWVHARHEAGAPPVPLRIEPEPGLQSTRNVVIPCPNGWAEFSVTALSHAVGAAFVTEAVAQGSTTSRWFGTLPVAKGAFYIQIPRVLPANVASEVMLVAPNPRTVVYAELHDREGRVAAAALPVSVDPTDPVPRAHFRLPALASGIYWLIASGEPRGAETLGGATSSRTLLIGSQVPNEPTIDVQNACTIGPWLAQRSAVPRPRWIALDGFPAQNSANRFRYRLGLAIGLVALFAAAILEAFLLWQASRDVERSMQHALEGEDGKSSVTKQSASGSVIVTVLVAVLGLAFLAALLVAKA